MASTKELRAAYKAGMRLCGANDSAEELEAFARHAYPPKMVTQPRVLRFEGVEYRLRDGFLEYHSGDHWHPLSRPEWWVAIRDLFANPTETVEVED